MTRRSASAADVDRLYDRLRTELPGLAAELEAGLGSGWRLAADVAAATGMRVEVESAADAGLDAAPEGRPHHVILLGRPVPPDAVAGAASAVAGLAAMVQKSTILTADDLGRQSGPLGRAGGLIP